MATNLLNQENIIKKVYDPPTQSLKVTGTSTITPGQMEVAIDASDDSIRIGDGSGNFATVNPDGSLNVIVSGSGVSGNPINKFNEINAIASGSVVIVNSYTVPAGKAATVFKVDVSGDNISKYTMYIDGNKINTKRTYFSSGLNASFEFNNNLRLTSGQVVTIEVDNFRPSSSDFNCLITVLEFS